MAKNLGHYEIEIATLGRKGVGWSPIPISCTSLLVIQPIGINRQMLWEMDQPSLTLPSQRI